MDGQSEAPTAAETAVTEISTLKTDQSFNDDFVGLNGHIPQRAAVKRKSELHQAAYGEPAEKAAPLPEAIQKGLEAPDAVSRAAAENMVPGTDVSDFKFQWADAKASTAEGLKERTQIAAEASMAIGASPSFAKATVEFIDQALSRPNVQPTTPDDLIDMLNQRFGMEAHNTVERASAVIALMPDAGRDWALSTLDKLDANTAAWFINRLSSVSKANAKNSE